MCVCVFVYVQPFGAALTSCASNWFTDHNERPNRITIIRLLFRIRSLDRNYQEVTNLLFVLPGLYFNILRTEKMCVARHFSARG